MQGLQCLARNKICVSKKKFIKFVNLKKTVYKICVVSFISRSRYYNRLVKAFWSLVLCFGFCILVVDDHKISVSKSLYWNNPEVIKVIQFPGLLCKTILS